MEDAPYSGSLLIPIDTIYGIVPLENVQNRRSYLKFDATITTCDGVTTEFKGLTQNIYYDSNATLTGMTFTQTVSGNSADGAFGTTYASERVILVYLNDGKYFMEDCEKVDGSYRILPPLNVPYTLVVMATDSNGKWAIESKDGEIVPSIQYVWNWDDEEVAMWIFMDQFGVLDSDYTCATNSFQLNGRDFESVFFDTNSVSSKRITGAVPYDDTSYGDVMEDFYRLRRCDYALFREPDGGRHYVAVTAMNHERHDREFYKVTVTMKERS